MVKKINRRMVINDRERYSICSPKTQKNTLKCSLIKEIPENTGNLLFIIIEIL